MAKKPGIPKGTRDFSPAEISKRNHIIGIIRKAFQQFGFQPIETPAFENLDTLMGKYGEEGDRLIFKILNSGDYLSKIDCDQLASFDSKSLTPMIVEKALRYDLTVPFARYVVMHQNEIDFPFKRYQIQPVWRADRPQKGRFREFYQCDADVVGPKSLLQEVELIQLYDKVFSELKISNVTIKLNNRKILSGIVEATGTDPKLITAFLVALDKLDKIGADTVKQEMNNKGISSEAIAVAEEHLFALTGDYKSQLNHLRSFLKESEIGQEGLEELEFISETLEKLGLQSAKIAVDVTLARGLNYYTGSIFEVVAEGIDMGSIGGGGRYDDLTGIFGMPGTSGVGISFGLERIYLVMEQLDLFPESLERDLDILCLNFGSDESLEALKLLTEFRASGLKADIYPVSAKIQKQMKYANNRKVPYVVLLGEKELQEGSFIVKNMEHGEQQTYSLSEASLFISSF